MTENETDKELDLEIGEDQGISSSLDLELAKAREEVKALNDKLLRTMAEADNMRKRYEKQIEEAKSYSISNFAKDLLSVSDNLARAISNKPSTSDKDFENFITGVEMTRQEMINIFAKYKLKDISPSIGDKFDYNQHYAVTQIPNSEYPVGTILQLVQSGYIIGDRLLRPATVTVTKAAE